MASQLVIRELSIVVAGRNHNPSILNPDFLKFNGIVPKEWQLAQPPICTEMIGQVVFSNGVSFVSQQDKIILSEPLALDGHGPVETPEIAKKYLKAVPHVAYKAVGINPKGHVCFDNDDDALNCVTRIFLAKGPWLEFGKGLRRTGVKFSYELEDRVLNLTVDTGNLQASDEPTSVVVFAGNFHHELSGDSTQDRLESAINELERWQEDVRSYRILVEARIFGEKQNETS